MYVWCLYLSIYVVVSKYLYVCMCIYVYVCVSNMYVCMYVLGEGVARSAGNLQWLPEAASLVVAVSVSGQLQPGDVQPDILLRRHVELLRPQGIHQRAVCMYVCTVCMFVILVCMYLCMYVCIRY